MKYHLYIIKSHIQTKDHYIKNISTDKNSVGYVWWASRKIKDADKFNLLRNTSFKDKINTIFKPNQYKIITKVYE